MDWYKVFQIAIPSITATGTTVLGCYLWYFKKKFGTYGDIDAKLQKLDKLEEIEKRLASAKFDVQMERIEDILKLEKEKAERNGLIEYQYYQNKENLERIMVFGSMLVEANEQIDRTTYLIQNKLLKFYSHCKENEFNLEEFYGYDLEAESNKTNLLSDKISLMYNIYFKSFSENDEFHIAYSKWKVSINEARIFSFRSIYEIQSLLFDEFSQDQIEKESLNKIHNQNKKIGPIINSMNKEFTHLISCFSEIADTIKNVK